MAGDLLLKNAVDASIVAFWRKRDKASHENARTPLADAFNGIEPPFASNALQLC
jgi:hypothetical protein